LTVTNIQTANDDIKAQSGFDPVSTQPADATSLVSATASTAAKAYAVLLGTVSQYLKDNPSKSLDDATSDFAIAYKAGGGALAGNPLITAAGNDFGANAANQTGVSSMAALQTLTENLATIDDEDPGSQRTVAAALFKDGTISGCGPDSVTDYSNDTCSVMYNYNLSGMPGCFNANYSNYIGHYQTNDTGIDWKTPGFSCANSSYINIYASPKLSIWSMNDGRVMDGTHNGIDIVHKDTNPKFYAITPGVVIASGTDSFNTIAIYDATNNLTALYLHASSVDPAIVLGATVKAGDFLAYQGNTGLGYAPGKGVHVHISVRVGKSTCACHDEPNGYLPPVATLLTYLKPPSASTPSVSSVSPTSMTANGSSQSVVISGNNFSSGNVVQFKWGQGSGAKVWTNSVSTPTVNSSSQIAASMNPGTVTDAIYVRVCSSNGSSNCSDGTQYVSVTVPALMATLGS
jgi:murein DD-endopeptidase MepM/ murein hydrolase activator NlpD